ncbi:23S rRNA (pseudouridine(1915)-N(3))-methyltransferase RlmH [Riemerella columbina]|uniref:23S rRNA (pseudouridine(1915)-N(3))-methyltransferase RlmH n=1 Tax=Riemerella columbina TaxID=103810 RepID=UPI00266F6BDF|nr:23S rRNA (pseudouridine(1915)-N(3))-methyltransferase RlmH [Riemerella columbina]WKS94733.1 23S rRNA (pseudouridine(1915)-N(3))-methyltransferase RlmH [Riemerella columbina]
MQLKLICIGKTDQKEIQQLMLYYQKRLPKHFNFEMLELPDIKHQKQHTPALIKKEEAKLFLNQIEPTDHLILLDEKGKQYTSRLFAEKINQLMLTSVKRIIFLIGGAYGFSDEIYQRAQEKFALSQLTFTHQMVRLFFIEQLYRADQILQGKPYHND